MCGWWISAARPPGVTWIDGLKALGEANINGLVLDLRGNPGGLVSEAVTVAGHFLQKNQTVVSHRGRASAEQVFRVKTQNPISRNYPIVVLVDKYSASASEIVAGALQDHDRPGSWARARSAKVWCRRNIRYPRGRPCCSPSPSIIRRAAA